MFKKVSKYKINIQKPIVLLSPEKPMNPASIHEDAGSIPGLAQ